MKLGFRLQHLFLRKHSFSWREVLESSRGLLRNYNAAKGSGRRRIKRTPPWGEGGSESGSSSVGPAVCLVGRLWPGLCLEWSSASVTTGDSPAPVASGLSGCQAPRGEWCSVFSPGLGLVVWGSDGAGWRGERGLASNCALLHCEVSIGRLIFPQEEVWRGISQLQGNETLPGVGFTLHQELHGSKVPGGVCEGEEEEINYPTQ